MAELTLAQTDDRYVREARLERTGDGVRLHVIAWHPRRAIEQHLAFSITLDPLSLGEPAVIAEGDALEALSVGGVPRVVSGASRDDASDGDERVSIERRAGRSSVILHRGP